MTALNFRMTIALSVSPDPVLRGATRSRDQRVTRVERLLGRFKIDNLPKLASVLSRQDVPSRATTPKTLASSIVGSDPSGRVLGSFGVPGPPYRVPSRGTPARRSGSRTGSPDQGPAGRALARRRQPVSTDGGDRSVDARHNGSSAVRARGGRLTARRCPGAPRFTRFGSDPTPSVLVSPGDLL